MFGLVGTDRVCERCVVCGRFLAGSFALKVCWLTGVGFSHVCVFVGVFCLFFLVTYGTQVFCKSACPLHIQEKR